jgi:hypothetical protein
MNTKYGMINVVCMLAIFEYIKAMETGEHFKNRRFSIRTQGYYLLIAILMFIKIDYNERI